MKLIIFLSVVATLTHAETWQQMKSPMENPRYQEFLSKLYSNPEFTENKREGKIVGGAPASPNQFPYQIYGYYDESWLCGGSIISKTYILTAAHCTFGTVFVDIYAGSILRTATAPWETRVEKKNYVQHPAYNDGTTANDIALIRTPEIPINDVNIGIIQLPSKADAAVNIDGFSAVVSGFGRFSDNSQSTAANLLYVEVPIINIIRCIQTFGSDNVNGNNVCVDSGVRGACGGDSGGPLTTYINGSKVQVGIVSFGAAAGCELGYPDVYTRVGSYLDWISENSGAETLSRRLQVGIVWAILPIVFTSRLF